MNVTGFLIRRLYAHPLELVLYNSIQLIINHFQPSQMLVKRIRLFHFKEKNLCFKNTLFAIVFRLKRCFNVSNIFLSFAFGYEVMLSQVSSFENKFMYKKGKKIIMSKTLGTKSLLEVKRTQYCTLNQYHHF